MPNLFQAAALCSLAENAPSTKTQSRVLSYVSFLAEIKSNSQWGDEWLKSERFILTDVPVGRIANPIKPNIDKFLQALRCSQQPDQPIVIDLNKKEIGLTHGYYPKVIVVHGSDIYAAAEHQRRDSVKAWIGIEAAKLLDLDISADHDIGANELNRKLNALLTQKFKQKSTSPAVYDGNKVPWIQEVYPLEDYFIYTLGMDTYKQAYTIGDDLEPAFKGQPTKVRATYINAGEMMPHGMNHTTPRTTHSPHVSSTPHHVSGPVRLAKTEHGVGHKIPHPHIGKSKRSHMGGPHRLPNQHIKADDPGMVEEMQTKKPKVRKPKSRDTESSITTDWTTGTQLQKPVKARDFSDKQRSSLAKKGKALPDGSFPIANKEDLGNAKQAIGRSKNPGKARAFINKRAKQMGEPGIGASKYTGMKGCSCAKCKGMKAGGWGSGAHMTVGTSPKKIKIKMRHIRHKVV